MADCSFEEKLITLDALSEEIPILADYLFQSYPRTIFFFFDKNAYAGKQLTGRGQGAPNKSFEA